MVSCGGTFGNVGRRPRGRVRVRTSEPDCNATGDFAARADAVVALSSRNEGAGANGLLCARFQGRWPVVMTLQRFGSTVGRLGGASRICLTALSGVRRRSLGAGVRVLR